MMIASKWNVTKIEFQVYGLPRYTCGMRAGRERLHASHVQILNSHYDLRQIRTLWVVQKEQIREQRLTPYPEGVNSMRIVSRVYALTLHPGETFWTRS